MGFKAIIWKQALTESDGKNENGYYNEAEGPINNKRRLWSGVMSFWGQR